MTSVDPKNSTVAEAGYADAPTICVSYVLVTVCRPCLPTRFAVCFLALKTICNEVKIDDASESGVLALREKRLAISPHFSLAEEIWRADPAAYGCTANRT